jgi:fumarylacetoacetase
MEREPRPAYLDGQADRLRGALDIALEVHLSTEGIRAAGAAPARLVRTNSSRLHWTVGQLIAHQTLNGAPLHPGDLMATGTVSGDTPETGGSLLELSRAGRVPIALSAHDTRTFLEDGDEVIVTASCTSGNASRIGFGECLGRIKPARDF